MTKSQKKTENNVYTIKKKGRYSVNQNIKIKKAKVKEKECVACGCCLKVCPKSAIKIKKGLFAEIDKKVCVACGKCIVICPASVIEFEVNGI